MNHKHDIYYLAAGLLLASVVNILRLGFDVPLPHWLSLTALISSILLIGIYAVRYWQGRKEAQNNI